jgi:glutaredoxin 3
MKFAVTIALVSTMFAASAFAFSPTVRNAIGRSAPRFSSAAAAAARADTMQMMSATPADFVKNEIASHDVVVFSKTYCPFCTATKGLLQDLSIKAKVIELDEVPNGSQIQAALLDLSGQRTVPNVFVKGGHLGGNDDTQAAARTGKLQEMLK